MAREELQISIIMLWKEVYNRTGKMTPEILNFSTNRDNEFIEEISKTIHIQYVKVPVKFFSLTRDKQFNQLKKLADVNKIQKFKTVAELIEELQNAYDKDALIKVLYYNQLDDNCHYAPVSSFCDDGYNRCFEIEIETEC